MKTFKNLSDRRIGYIAGFLDADGCINAQLVRREDYKFKYQIRVSVTFFQKKKRKHVLLHLQKDLGCGTLRTRKDGICELTIVGKQSVQSLLTFLVDDLDGKRPQARKVLQICESLAKNMMTSEFLQLCELADSVAEENDSKKRTRTAAEVKDILLPESP